MPTAHPQLVDLPPTKVMKLANRNCPYCNVMFSPNSPPTLKHVVARRFVPRETMLNAPNLHLNACRRFN